MPVDSAGFTKLVSEIATYPSAVLNGRDGAGYPYSVRCHPQPDAATRTLLLPDAAAPLTEGPAGLLCHEHDDHLWRQRSVLIRGRIAREGAGWRFTPEKVIPGLSQSPLGLGSFFIHARGVAAKYLAKRNLPRPVVPWADIIRIKRQAQANLRARGERY